MDNILYLDHAATTKIDEDVFRQMLPYFRNAYGNGPVYYGQTTTTFPANLFTGEPVVTATRQGREGAGLIHISSYSVTATQASYFVTNTSAVYNNAPLGVSFEVKGLWKTYSAPTTKYRWHRTA